MGNVSVGIPWVMLLGFGNEEKETGKKGRKKKELDQQPTFAWLNQHLHWWVGYHGKITRNPNFGPS